MDKNALLCSLMSGQMTQAKIPWVEAAYNPNFEFDEAGGSKINIEKEQVFARSHFLWEFEDWIPSSPWNPKPSTIYRGRVTEPGHFGENLIAVKRFIVDISKREAAQLTDSDMLRRWDGLTKLKHENLVSYHEISMKFMRPGPQSGRIDLQFAMDYSNGKDLRTLLYVMGIENRTLHVKTLFDFSKQIASGLAYLHENNIAHGGLKQENILVDKSSHNSFRLRLCGLDDFLPSFSTLLLDWHYCSAWMPPEMLMIIKDAKVTLLDDPYFSAIHMIHKLVPKGSKNDLIMDKLIALYGDSEKQDRMWRNVEALMPFLETAYSSKPRRVFVDCLHNMHSLNILAPGAAEEEFSGVLRFLQAICANDEAVALTTDEQMALLDEIFQGKKFLINARTFCKALGWKTECHECQPTLPKTRVEILDSFMSMYFQHRRVPQTGLGAEARASVYRQPSLLCASSHSVPIDGRKADIWSLGKIIYSLALHTFDASQTIIWRKSEHVRPEKFAFYTSNFMARDFWHAFCFCLRESPGERMTAIDVVNKLVALEEKTYGSTWVNNSEHDIAEEEVSACHRHMLEEIGRECEYEYCFWKDFLGQGAYGYVYKATITKFRNYKGNKTVALKEVTLNHLTVKQMRQDHSWGTAREQWRKLISLKHPHLVTYHKVSVRKLTKGAGIEFIMDYCEGGDLDSLIAQCRTGVCSLSVQAVHNYAVQLATGIHYLHENKFVHGDLKPGNVFMSRATGDPGNRMLRIGDLDSAVRIREDSSQPERKDLAGTGPYMSPEMVKHLFEQEHENIGFPTDIWSFGCVVCDLANCSVGIKKRLFRKTITNAERDLETHEIERQDFSADTFLFKLSQGYYPFVSELIHRNVRDIIQCCLVQSCRDRATVGMVVEQLLYDANLDSDDIASNSQVLRHSRRVNYYWLGL